MKRQTISHYDKMTGSRIEPLIIRMAVPTIISMLVTNIYNLVDTAFVGQLGTSASGAVGVVFGFMAVLQAIGFLFGQGSGSILARRLGAKDNEGASVTASTGVFCSLTFSIIAAVICFVFLDQLVRMLGSTDTIAPYAKTYIFFILISTPFTVAGFSLNNILRFEGHAMFGMIGLMSGAVLNIIGDAFFMFVLDMGIAGAGLSTCIAQIISFCILLSMFVRGKTQSRLTLKYVAFDKGLITEIVGTGMPSLLRQGLTSLAIIVLNMAAAAYGDAAIAAMSIVSRIAFFVFSVPLGIGQGFQPVSGFNYGAKKYKRVRKAYKFALILGEITIIVLTAAAMLYPEELIRVFRDDPEVVSIGVRALQLQLITQLMVPVCIVTEMIMQSTGKKLMASILSSLKSGVIFIPLLVVMAGVRGLAGIQEAQAVANVVVMIPMIIAAVWFFKNMPKEDE